MKKAGLGNGWLAGAFCFYAFASLISMAVMSIGAGVLALSILVYIVRNRPVFVQTVGSLWQSPWVRRFFWVSLALALALLTSLVVARLNPLVYDGFAVQVSFGKDMAKAWYLAWPFILLFGLKQLDSSQRQKVIRTWLCVYGILSVIGIIQYFTGWPRSQFIPNHPGHFHAVLFIGHHLSVSSILIFPFFAALDLTRRKPGAQTFGISRRWLWLSVALGLVTLFLTFSRMLWLALPVGIAIYVLVAMPRKLRGPAVILGIVLGIAAWNFPPVRERITSTGGTNERYSLWEANREFFLKRPWTGTGWHHNLNLSAFYYRERYPGQWKFVGHAHNNFLEMLGSTGIFGTVAWLAWNICVFGMIFKAAFRSSAAPQFALGLFCAWVVFQLNGLTQVNFWDSKVLHQMMWVSAWALLWVSEAQWSKKSQQEKAS